MVLKDKNIYRYWTLCMKHSEGKDMLFEQMWYTNLYAHHHLYEINLSVIWQMVAWKSESVASLFQTINLQIIYSFCGICNILIKIAISSIRWIPFCFVKKYSCWSTHLLHLLFWSKCFWARHILDRGCSIERSIYHKMYFPRECLKIIYGS